MKIGVILPSLRNKAPIQVAKDIVDRLIYEGCEVEVFYFKDVVKEEEVVFNCPVKKISLFKKIDYGNYDIIHSHMLKPDCYVWLHRKRIKALCVSTLHNEIDKVLKDYYGVIVSKILTPLWVMFLKAQDQVVCLSKCAKTHLETEYKLKKATFIYNGRSLSSGVLRSHDVDILRSKREKFTVLGVIANISKIKGIEQIINSLDSLENYCLVIIGDGPDLESLKDLVQNKNLGDRCSFFGHKNSAHLFLKYIDIYMMTSYSEGFPLVLIEAAQYKKPIVCSNLPIFKEFFGVSEVSFFELDNGDSLIDAVKVANDRKGILSRNVYDVYLKKYTKNIMGENYYREFRSLLE